MAITRRTRNAFAGSSRHKGSNPFISVSNLEETTAESVYEIDVFCGGLFFVYGVGRISGFIGFFL